MTVRTSEHMACPVPTQRRAEAERRSSATRRLRYLTPTVIWWSDAILGVVVNLVSLVGVLAWRIKCSATRQPRSEGLA